MVEAFTWKAVVAFVGSIGMVCLTVYRIFAVNKKPNGNGIEKRLKTLEDEGSKSIQQSIAKLSQDSAVQEAQILALKEDLERLHDSFEKLNDLLLKLFISEN